LLKRVRDFAEVQNQGKINADIACSALSALEVDSRGLDAMDRKILKTMMKSLVEGPQHRHHVGRHQ